MLIKLNCAEERLRAIRHPYWRENGSPVASSFGSTDLSSRAGLDVPQLLKFLDLLAPASALFFWREDLSK
jgi:hypothetical protein